MKKERYEEFEDTKSESVNRRTDKTMAKKRRTKGQKTIYIKLKIE